MTGALALEDIGAVCPVRLAALPAPQHVDVLVVVRAGMRREANHNLSVPVPVACFVDLLPIAGNLLPPGQRYSISWSFKAALNLPKPTYCPPWSSSLAADSRGGKTDRNAPRGKSPQGQSHPHLPRSRNPRDHSTPIKLLTPRRHILDTRVDLYILDALTSQLLSVAASCAPYRQERPRVGTSARRGGR
jgi:hypothetical protein